MKSKILLFIKTPPPVTGATVMNKYICDSNVIKKKFKIRSICISYMKQRSEMGKWKVSKFVAISYVMCKLLKELLFYKPTLVYFQISPHGFAFYRDFIYVIIMKLFRVDIVFHMHGKGIAVKSEFAQKFYRYCFKNEYIICLSSLLQNDIKDVYNGRVHIVPNGIPNSNFEGNAIKPDRDAPKILFLSNLIQSKGVFNYIEALSILSKKGIEFNGIIVGAEADISEADLSRILYQNNLNEKIQYLGPKYEYEKYQIYSHANIFVLPTKNECFPGVILEAMQFSLPVVSTREGAIPEIVDDGITGFVVEKDSPNQLAEKIEFLIKNPENCRKLGQAGRKKYEQKFTLQQFETNMIDVFTKILKEKSLHT
jgi:glycosyltransferase involved in cell wall biosynthesis